MYRKATVPLDGSKLAESVLPHVEVFVKQFNLSDVTFVRVVEREELCVVESCAEANALVGRESVRMSSAEEYLTQLVNQISYDGTRFHAQVLVGRMPDSLINFVKQNNTDVVIMATHGFSALTRWVRGNVTEEILRSVKVPVFVVRALSAQVDLESRKLDLSPVDTVRMLSSPCMFLNIQGKGGAKYYAKKHHLNRQADSGRR
jgi:nucleotide-binding universal stress UspA family protein